MLRIPSSPWLYGASAISMWPRAGGSSQLLAARNGETASTSRSHAGRVRLLPGRIGHLAWAEAPVYEVCTARQESSSGYIWFGVRPHPAWESTRVTQARETPSRRARSARVIPGSAASVARNASVRFRMDSPGAPRFRTVGARFGSGGCGSRRTMKVRVLDGTGSQAKPGRTTAQFGLPHVDHPLTQAFGITAL